MDSIGYTKPTPRINSLMRSPNDDNLSPAAKEAKRTIPKGIVKERVAIYDKQANQLTNKNRTISKVSLENLPQDMKLLLCTFLDSSSLNTVMNVSKEMHETIGSSTFFQNKILHAFAMENIMSIESLTLRYDALQNIAVSLAKSNDMAGSKSIFDLLRARK